jgi:hypothetical protein
MDNQATPPTVSEATALTQRCLQVFTTGLKHADPLTFDHEAERVEAMRPSPLTEQMRAVVDTERARRAELAGAVA